MHGPQRDSIYAMHGLARACKRVKLDQICKYKILALFVFFFQQLLWTLPIYLSGYICHLCDAQVGSRQPMHLYTTSGSVTYT